MFTTEELCYLRKKLSFVSPVPRLDSRLGISIPMEDMCISCVWDFKFRFWQNDRSKMYVLENTGEFVRTNELQEGDFVFIYADTISGKYLIRGVKEVQPSRPPVTTNLSASSSAAASFLPVTDE
ncbi:unnamed protein product [Cuscuta epithymum]|uniref:TF-B3 domain-containing protein n=1 Tax=Cuscuta epithymum TaxID=186058 RepID=A0AAV0FTH6_9ASTE|nr:unnamed protein product [Cuscuta epithymum]